MTWSLLGISLHGVGKDCKKLFLAILLTKCLTDEIGAPPSRQPLDTRGTEYNARRPLDTGLRSPVGDEIARTPSCITARLSLSHASPTCMYTSSGCMKRKAAMHEDAEANYLASHHAIERCAVQILLAIVACALRGERTAP